MLPVGEVVEDMVSNEVSWDESNVIESDKQGMLIVSDD